MKNFLIFLMLLLAGCTTGIPEHNLVVLQNPMDTASVDRMIHQYNDAVMEKANIQSFITFRFRGRAMSALGITKLDAGNKSFLAAGLNPMAVTLFKLKMEKGKLISTYVIPQFGEHANLHKTADAMGRDIARIYFNRKINLQGKSIKFDKYSIRVNEKDGPFSYRYILSGNPLKLTTKSKYQNDKKLWSVDYYEYKTIKTKIKIKKKEMPFKIFFKNYKYGYSLDIETKEIKHEPVK